MAFFKNSLALSLLLSSHVVERSFAEGDGTPDRVSSRLEIHVSHGSQIETRSFFLDYGYGSAATLLLLLMEIMVAMFGDVFDAAGKGIVLLHALCERQLMFKESHKIGASARRE
jgi:hypothetical protein